MEPTPESVVRRAKIDIEERLQDLPPQHQPEAFRKVGKFCEEQARRQEEVNERVGTPDNQQVERAQWSDGS